MLAMAIFFELQHISLTPNLSILSFFNKYVIDLYVGRTNSLTQIIMSHRNLLIILMLIILDYICF